MIHKKWQKEGTNGKDLMTLSVNLGNSAVKPSMSVDTVEFICWVFIR